MATVATLVQINVSKQSGRTSKERKSSTLSTENNHLSTSSQKSGQYAAKKREHEKSSVRCKVVHVFAVVKRLFWLSKNTIPRSAETDA